jgi:hypothetical protein
MTIMLGFKKIPSKRFIKYDKPNDEPPEHYEGKIRIHSLMGRLGYVFIANTSQQEFALPTIHTPLDGDKHYQIDALMYNEKLERIVAVEVNGEYHYANRWRIHRTNQKHEEVVNFITRRKYIECDGIKYNYKLSLCHGFKTEELVGKNAMSDDEILAILS